MRSQYIIRKLHVEESFLVALLCEIACSSTIKKWVKRITSGKEKGNEELPKEVKCFHEKYVGA